MRRRLFRGLGWGALAVLSLSMACVDKVGGDTGVAPLYVYDGTTNSVLVWNDINDLYKAGHDGTTVPGPNRTIDLNTAAPSLALAWGGMAMDDSTQRLYLASADGSKILRILHAGTKSGDLTTSPGEDRISFSVDMAAGSFSGGALGQVAVNSSGDLLITQWSSTQSQIWKISDQAQTANPNGKFTGASYLVNNAASGDSNCTGVAVVGTQSIYAFFGNGNNITVGNDDFTGPRLRYGTFSGGFLANTNVIINKSTDTSKATKLLAYGCLAYDTSNSRLYTATSATDFPILVHTSGKFSSQSPVDVVPSNQLAGPTNGALRIIAHAGQKDWMVGAESTDGATQGTGTNKLWIWRAPSQTADTANPSPVYVTLPDASSTSGTVKILGLALDGSQ